MSGWSFLYGKKILSLLLAFALWLLCGCAREDSEMQRALDFRTALLQSGGCAFTAEVTADYGEQVYRFTMDCTWSPDGGAALTLTAPQTLEGIRAEVSADGARVVYEDTAVGFESLAGGRLAPMALPYLLGSGWYEGYISACGMENGLLRMTCLEGYEEEELAVDTWLDTQSGQPCRCEISYQGQTLLIAEISAFAMNRGNNENTEKNMGGGVSG